MQGSARTPPPAAASRGTVSPAATSIHDDDVVLDILDRCRGITQSQLHAVFRGLLPLFQRERQRERQPAALDAVVVGPLSADDRAELEGLQSDFNTREFLHEFAMNEARRQRGGLFGRGRPAALPAAVRGLADPPQRQLLAEEPGQLLVAQQRQLAEQQRQSLLEQQRQYLVEQQRLATEVADAAAEALSSRLAALPAGYGLLPELAAERDVGFYEVTWPPARPLAHLSPPGLPPARRACGRRYSYQRLPVLQTCGGSTMRHGRRVYGSSRPGAWSGLHLVTHPIRATGRPKKTARAPATQTHTHSHVHVHTLACTHTHTHTHTRTRTRTHTHL